MRQSTVTRGRNSHISYVKVTSDPEVGHFSCAMGVPRQTGCFWTNFQHFLREGGTRILKSFCPALLLNGEVCAVDALVADDSMIP